MYKISKINNKDIIDTSLRDSLSDYHVGMIIAFAGSTAPSGWFICDGREISRTTYSKLFALIDVTYGNGDGTTTFNIPDLRECVLVGCGTSTRSAINTHDVYEIGEFKDDQMQGHKHNYVTYSAIWKHGDNNKDVMMNTSTGTTSTPIGDGVNGTPRTGMTTHSKQLGINYIIKF